jgi:hypothetical protein
MANERRVYVVEYSFDKEEWKSTLGTSLSLVNCRDMKASFDRMFPERVHRVTPYIPAQAPAKTAKSK